MTVEEAFRCVMSFARFTDPMVEAIGDVWVNKSEQLQIYGWTAEPIEKLSQLGAEEFICSDTTPKTSHTKPASLPTPASTAPTLPESGTS